MQNVCILTIIMSDEKTDIKNLTNKNFSNWNSRSAIFSCSVNKIFNHELSAGPKPVMCYNNEWHV